MRAFYMTAALIGLLGLSASCDQNPPPPLYGGTYLSDPLQATATPSGGPVSCLSFSLVAVPAPAYLSPTSLSSGVSLSTYVLRTLADWQTYCGTASLPAPVDFNTQMILVYDETLSNGWCGGQITLSTICRDASRVTVSAVFEDGEQGLSTLGAPPTTALLAVT